MKVLASNRRARYDYDIIERYICGISLFGAEVKSVRAGHLSLKGSFVVPQHNELFLVNAHITPYKFAAPEHSDPTRTRKLLLHRKQIDAIIAASQERGMSVVPLTVGLERNLIKVEIGLGRGKHKFDKREVKKKRLMLREASREIKSDNK